jgi:hypothetical protein
VIVRAFALDFFGMRMSYFPSKRFAISKHTNFLKLAIISTKCQPSQIFFLILLTIIYCHFTNIETKILIFDKPKHGR